MNAGMNKFYIDKINCPFTYIIPPEGFLVITYPEIMSGLYSISETGQVINNFTSRELKSHPTKQGYLTCGLLKSDRAQYPYKVHRLVAWEFCPGRDINLHVNHKDGNKLNNHYSNLEWVTPLENARHAWNTGLCKALRGEQIGTSKLTEQEVHHICQLLRDTDLSYKEIKDIAIKETNSNISQCTIKEIAYGKTWKHISKFYYPILKKRKRSDWSENNEF